jgi:predicted RNase H-like HicB family nuclease
MELYQLNYILHEPCEDQGWLYMAEIPELPGCRAWAETPTSALAELSAVAEQFILSYFILSYKERGKPLPAGIIPSPAGEGKLSVAV